MAAILDQFGKPLDAAILKEPQTSKVVSLKNQYLTPMLGGLTPARVATYLRQADDGDLLQQHRLFADMEDRDPHLGAEMNKRKLAVLDLDWNIEPPCNPTPAEEKAAEWLEGVLEDSVIPIEDLILSMMEGVGHGFAAVEIEWRQEDGERLPRFHPRPQEWFRLDRERSSLRLRDASPEGMPLASFGWILHTHGTPKSGYAARGGLYRSLVWPFLYKAFSLGDFAEFLETYGLPIIVGKYMTGSDAEAKASLMRAVAALGHDARAIMPADMELEINSVTSNGSGTPHLAMMDYCDKAISKSILGATLTTQADGKTSTNALGNVHNEVRMDILSADAREIAGTITRDLLYALVALNIGGVTSLRRCPRLVFDTGEPEDLALYADALPKLAQGGARIPIEWVHAKLRIPLAKEQEPVFGQPAPAVPENPPSRKTRILAEDPQDPPAAMKAKPGPQAAFPDQEAIDSAIMKAVRELAGPGQDFLAPVMEALRGAQDYSQAYEAIAQLYPELDSTELERRLGNAMTLAEAWGRLHAQ